MIEYTDKSIFDSEAEILVNPVNCVGVMGAGLAKEFKERFPDHFTKYQYHTQRRQINVGKVKFVDAEFKRYDDNRKGYYRDCNKQICLFPTKHHWKDNSKLEEIEMGLRDFIRQLNNSNLYSTKSYSFPKLGCGLGGLNWDDVRYLLEGYLRPLRNKIWVHV